MDTQTKLLAYKAIDENVLESKARKIARYVFECEIWGQDTVSPNNKHLADKFNWTIDTVRVAISQAKRSQFISTTGRGKTRCLELNVSFLKGKMAEIQQRKPLKNNLLESLSDVISDVKGNKEGNNLGNIQGNKEGNILGLKNGSTKPENEEKGGYNNNNSNNNTSEHSSRGVENVIEEEVTYVTYVSDDSDPLEKTKRKITPEAQQVFGAFSKSKKGWMMHAAQRESADRLYHDRGLDEVRKALSFYSDHKGEKYCPIINTPFDLEAKWSSLHAFGKRKSEEL